MLSNTINLKHYPTKAERAQEVIRHLAENLPMSPLISSMIQMYIPHLTASCSDENVDAFLSQLKDLTAYIEVGNEQKQRID